MVAAIVGEERLYPNEDPLQPVNIICYGEGDQSAWHYDSTNAFTMTLMLQAADEAGVFELAANTRNGEDDEDIAYMTEVQKGVRDRVSTVSREPGKHRPSFACAFGLASKGKCVGALFLSNNFVTLMLLWLVSSSQRRASNVQLEVGWEN